MAKKDRAVYSAQQLHKEFDVPERYLRRLLTDLSKHKFIKSTQGRLGGFTFKRDISKIFLIEKIDAIDGKNSVKAFILRYDTCVFNHPCLMHEIWEETRQRAILTLSKTSLKDVQKVPLEGI